MSWKKVSYSEIEAYCYNVKSIQPFIDDISMLGMTNATWVNVYDHDPM